MWVKKNPRQVLSRQGLFNPLIRHRQHRVLRRHATLLEFFMRAAFNHRSVRRRDAGRVCMGRLLGRTPTAGHDLPLARRWIVVGRTDRALVRRNGFKRLTAMSQDSHGCDRRCVSFSLQTARRNRAGAVT